MGALTKRSWRLARLMTFLAVVYAIASHFNWHQVVASWAQARPAYLLPVVFFLTPMAILLRSLRWRGLVPGGDQLRLTKYVRAYLVGFLANSLLPGKLGDLLKARLICQPGIDYRRSLASALADRVLEGVVLLWVLQLAALGGGLPSWAQHIILWAGGLSLAVLLGMACLFRYSQLFSRVSAHALFFLSPWQQHRIASRLLELFVGFESLTSRRRVFRALSYSLGIWALEILAVGAFLAAFSVPVPRLLAALLLLVALNFGTLLPLSPGSIGVYQALCVFTLSLWHVNQALSFSMGLSMQAGLYLPVYMAGLLCLLGPRRKEKEEEKLSIAGPVIDRVGN